MTYYRAANFLDYEAIAKLHAESWRKTYRGIFTDEFLDGKVEQDRIDTWYTRLQFPKDNQFVTVATQQDRILGFGCIYLNDNPIYGTLLDNLHVAPDLHMSGIGKQLMKACAKYISEKCASNKMYLWVYELNTNARRMYEHLGAAHMETIVKVHTDQSTARACRYYWEDVSILLK
jgi:ribosomal protein S18 acetylase RimI-like enzyme